MSDDITVFAFFDTSSSVHTRFKLFDFNRDRHDWLGQIFLNRELQLINSKSFLLFMKIYLNNVYFSALIWKYST